MSKCLWIEIIRFILASEEYSHSRLQQLRRPSSSSLDCFLSQFSVTCRRSNRDSNIDTVFRARDTEFESKNSRVSSRYK